MSGRWRKVLPGLALLAVGGVLGLLAAYVGHAAVQATSGEAFCGTCHVMEPMVESYRRDAHSGANALGIRAKCADCHLPHDTVAGYLVQKARDGIRDVYVNTFDEPTAIDWHARREERARYVYDSGCLTCHRQVTAQVSGSGLAERMHALYAQHRDGDEALECVSCHVVAGHRDLGHLVEQAYGPPGYGTW